MQREVGSSSTPSLVRRIAVVVAATLGLGLGVVPLALPTGPAAAATAATPTASEVVDRLSRTDPLAFRTGEVVFDPSRRVLWTLDGLSRELQKVDPVTGSVVTTLPLGFNPSKLLLDEATGRLVVTGHELNEVGGGPVFEVVDAASLTVVVRKATPVGDVVVDPVSGALWAHTAGNTVTAFDAGLAPRLVVSLPGATNRVAFDAARGRVIVVSDTVNGSDGGVVGPEPIVTAVDAATGVVLESHEIGVGALGGLGTSGIFVDPVDGDVLVQTWAQSFVLDGRSLRLKATLPTGGGVAFDPVSHAIFTGSHTGGLAVVDGRTDTLLRVLKVNNGEAHAPVAVAYDGVTGNVWFADHFRIDMAAPDVAVTSPPIATRLTTASPYRFALSATGPLPHTWSVSSGALPPGLSLDGSTGVVSGTPATGGTFSWSASVRTGAGATIHLDATQTVVGIERVSGGDRTATAVAVAQAAFPDGASTVFVASSRGYADALSAGPAAAHLGGPLLLSEPGRVSAAVLDEIARLAPDQVVVVGGVAALSPSVERDVARVVPRTVRWSGADRYETSRLIADRAFADGVDQVFLATGRNYPDALSAGAVAAAVDGAIVLVDGAVPELDDSTISSLSGLDPLDVFVVGGPAAVTWGIYDDLVDSPYAANRFGGSDRYVTAANLNSYFYDTVYGEATRGSDVVFVVTGEN